MEHRIDRRPNATSRGRLLALAQLWSSCDRGNMVVEFALLAPALAFCLLATFDLGMGMSERMALDHVLRSGAQTAMTDPTEETVRSAMSSAAELTFSDLPALSAVRFCACPEAVESAVQCSTVCSESQPTFTYFRMSAETTYSGNIMPAFDLRRSIQVQVR